MPKRSARPKTSGAAAIAAVSGKRIVFTEEDSADGEHGANQDQSLDEDSADGQGHEEDPIGDQTDSQSVSEDDEAPEAVGFAVDQRKARAEEEVEIARRKAKVERQRQIQAQREAEKKAKLDKTAAPLSGKVDKYAKTKRPSQEDSDDEAEDVASGDDSIEDSEGEGFHTDSDDADLDADLDEEEAEEDENDNDEDDEGDDETIENDALDPATKRLHARMQKAMEAAERRAMDENDEPSKRINSKAENKELAAVEGEEPSEYDMGPMPLPQSILRVAAEADLLRKKAEKRKAEEARSNATKKRRRKIQRDEEDLTSRTLNSRTAIQLLPETFSLSTLPPVVAPRAQISQKTNLDGFRKRAMRRSGVALGAKANTRKPASLALAQGSKAPAPRFDR